MFECFFASCEALKCYFEFNVLCSVFNTRITCISAKHKADFTMRILYYFSNARLALKVLLPGEIALQKT